MKRRKHSNVPLTPQEAATLKQTYDHAFDCVARAKEAEALGRLPEARKLYLDGLDKFVAARKLEPLSDKRKHVRENVEMYMEHVKRLDDMIRKDNERQRSLQSILSALPDAPTHRISISKRGKQHAPKQDPPPLTKRSSATSLNKRLDARQPHSSSSSSRRAYEAQRNKKNNKPKKKPTLLLPNELAARSKGNAYWDRGMRAQEKGNLEQAISLYHKAIKHFLRFMELIKPPSSSSSSSSGSASTTSFNFNEDVAEMYWEEGKPMPSGVSPQEAAKARELVRSRHRMVVQRRADGLLARVRELKKRLEEEKEIERDVDNLPLPPSSGLRRTASSPLPSPSSPLAQKHGGFDPNIHSSETPAKQRDRTSSTSSSSNNRRGSNRRKTARRPAGNLSKREIAVLRKTSLINGNLYFPFMADDIMERFDGFEEPFEDPAGLLELSPSQIEHFGAWRRPHELCVRPKMITALSAESIKQTIITDCSFVSSLAVVADYERRFKKKLITRCIYPQSPLGEPLVNPEGKYMVRLVLNGVPRKVVVDDQLPVDRDGALMCSYSANSSEFWVSILEKAFLKVMGGYHFPGSNSGVDLHVLTGWIPERVGLRGDSFERERVWERLKSGLEHGDCLVTSSTGDLTEAEADKAGLVPTHAYAVLRVVEVDGHRLLQLKNPWSRLRWKGNWSPTDKRNWTPKLRAALGYDPDAALKEGDNGIFWIDYNSLLHFYASIYMNWNPRLFAYHCTMHGDWPKEIGPASSAYNREYCPQYGVTVRSGANVASLWILLSKHVTQKTETDEQFITLHVYQSDTPGLVYYAEPCLFAGTYINNPHYLARVDVPATDNSDRDAYTYKIVVSQYEKKEDLFFTLQVYSTAPTTIRRLVDPYSAYSAKLAGEWDASNAGGSTNMPVAFIKNPQFLVSCRDTTNLLFKILAPKEFSVNIMVFARYAYNDSGGGGGGGGGGGNNNDSGGVTDENKSSNDEVKRIDTLEEYYRVKCLGDSGAYRRGFAYVELSSDKLQPARTGPGGVYQIAVFASTFRPGQHGRFAIQVGSTDSPISITAL
eukprot:TRINITY_DN65989_c5_g16_i1.p1 TRINITY_DN65989_c5_g16~~TRINITY_DN65989_c5_g16_i1.p1  ORF type:complete len:1053 (+),score=533.21 TRINITY_DN65989_c5_g16_i1:160-3318(+)